MTALALVNSTSAATELEPLLIEMTRFGRPRVGMYGEGWHCHVEMNTNTTGTSFEVKSDFKCQTPLDAARQCRTRINEALAALGAKQ